MSLVFILNISAIHGLDDLCCLLISDFEEQAASDLLKVRLKKNGRKCCLFECSAYPSYLVVELLGKTEKHVYDTFLPLSIHAGVFL